MENEILDNPEINNAELPVAGFGDRIAAYLIDLLPLGILGYMLAIYFPDTFSVEGFSDFSFSRSFAFFVWILYSLFMDASSWQGTLGKKIIGIKTVSYTGHQLTMGESALRNLFKIVSALPFSLGFIWFLFDKKHRTWHDMVAKTLVVAKKPPVYTAP